MSAQSGRLAGSAIVYSLANIMNSAIPFLLLPLLTRVLTPHEFGQVTIFTTLLAACAGIVGLSAHGAINVRYFQQDGAHPGYVGTALAIVAASASAVLATVLLLAPWLSGWTGLSALWLALAVTAAAAQALIQIRLVMWLARGDAVRYGSFQVLQTTLNLSLSVLLVLVGMGWEGRGAGIAIAMLLFAVAGVVSLRRSHLVDWRIEATSARDIMRFGVPLMPHVIGTMFIATSDRLMVARLTSVQEAGVYAAGLQVGLVIGMIADAVVKALGPWVYARLESSDCLVRRRVVHLTYVYFVGIAIAALVLGAAAPYLLLLVGESFRSSRDVVMYIALGGAFGGMYLMVVNYIFFTKRNELLSAASLSVGALNLVASYWLIGRHGIVGAAQAYALSQALLFLIVWITAAHLHPMPWLAALRPAPARPMSPGPTHSPES
jgi:O-antigen/teichoic acid export membrane protein